MDKMNARIMALIVVAACLIGMVVGSALTFAFPTSQGAISTTAWCGQ